MTTNSMEERAREVLLNEIDPREAEYIRCRESDYTFKVGSREAIRAILAAFAAQPDGMVLVPREPTPEMIEAGAMCEAAFGRDSEGVYYKPEFTWSAMVSAAVDGEGA